MTHLDDLPIDMFYLILDLLNLSDVLSLSLISHKYRKLILKYLLRRNIYSVILFNKPYILRSNIIQSVRDICVYGHNVDLTLYPNCKSLEIRRGTLILSKKIDSLEHLTLYHSDLFGDIDRLSRLKTLSLTSKQSCRPHEFSNTSPFHLSYFPPIPRYNSKIQLTSLHLYGFHINIDDLPYIPMLYLSDCIIDVRTVKQQNLDKVEYKQSDRPKFKTECLTIHKNFQPLDELISNSHTLTSLTLRICPYVTIDAYRMLTQLTELRVHCINRQADITGIENLINLKVMKFNEHL